MQEQPKSEEEIPTDPAEQKNDDKEKAIQYESAVKGLFSRALEKAKRIHDKYSIPDPGTKKTGNSPPE
jgi:hypothetical protein